MKIKIQEVVDIETDLKEVSAFLSDITPDCVKELGAFFSDNVRQWRIQKQITQMKEVKKLVEGAGLEIQKIPLKTLIPILENSSLEEDPCLEEKWTAMLANAASGNREVKPSYPEMLKELSPIEVKILDKMFDDFSLQTEKYEEGKLQQFKPSKIAEIFQINEETIELVRDNFLRLNLVKKPSLLRKQTEPNKTVQWAMALVDDEDSFHLTALGFNFIQSCRFKS